MTRILEVSESGYYAWLKRATQSKVDSDASLKCNMADIREHSRNRFGYRQVWRVLRREGHKVSRKRVQRIMQAKLGVKVRKRTVKTTNSLHSYPIAPDLLERDFSASQPNQKWVSDITYVRTHEGWLYVSTVLDLFANRVVDWAARADMSEGLVLDALKMAFETRKPAAGLIVHSDRGVQYAAHACVQLLHSHHARQSMCRKGDCYDNAAMESWNGKYKVEWIPDQVYLSRSLAKLDLFTYIETQYNRYRPVARLGGLSPIQFELKFLTEFRKQ